MPFSHHQKIICYHRAQNSLGAQSYHCIIWIRARLLTHCYNPLCCRVSSLPLRGTTGLDSICNHRSKCARTNSTTYQRTVTKLDHGKVEIMKAIEKKTLIGRIKLEIGEIPKQELDTMADCYYFGATDLIHFARDINIFTPEQERYFTSKAYTAYREYTKRRNENV